MAPPAVPFPSAPPRGGPAARGASALARDRQAGSAGRRVKASRNHPPALSSSPGGLLCSLLQPLPVTQPKALGRHGHRHGHTMAQIRGDVSPEPLSSPGPLALPNRGWPLGPQGTDAQVGTSGKMCPHPHLGDSPLNYCHGLSEKNSLGCLLFTMAGTLKAVPSGPESHGDPGRPREKHQVGLRIALEGPQDRPPCGNERLRWPLSGSGSPGCRGNSILSFCCCYGPVTVDVGLVVFPPRRTPLVRRGLDPERMLVRDPREPRGRCRWSRAAP